MEDSRSDLWLPKDIAERLAADFPTEDAPTLHRLLSECENESLRVIRCVVHLARADVGRLLHYIDSAAADYRDVIWWAEYDEAGRKVHDFTLPFGS